MIELTQGEIADRIAILELKKDAGLPTPELDELTAAYKGDERWLDALRVVNSDAWVAVERLNTFLYDLGPYSSESVLEDFKRCHFLNRRRIEIKNCINEEFNQPTEHKTWHTLTRSV